MTNFKLHSSKASKFYLITLLISILFIGGCSTKREIVNTDELVKISQPRVFGNTFKNGLYKTDMQIHDRELSGLIFFNKKENSMRVVMLSEVGLKYFDVELITGDQSEYMVHQLIDFLNHDKFTSSIQNFVGLMMMDHCGTFQTFKSDEQGGFFIREERKNGIKTDYHYNSNSGAVSKILQKKTTMILDSYDYLSPGNIIYKQGNINYTLTKVEKE